MLSLSDELVCFHRTVRMLTNYFPGIRINDTYIEELDSVQKFIKMQGWLLLTFFICLHNQLSSFNSIIVQMSENVIHQVDSKNEWLLLLVNFTAKFELVFVLTFENAFF